LLDNVRHAFVGGMSTMLWVCGGIAVLGVFLTWLFLPREAVKASSELSV